MSLIFHGMRLQNWRGYVGEHKIDFRLKPGLFYVRGDNRVDPELEANAAGKTSLFDALSWCLYGKTLRDERPGDFVEPYTGEKPTAVAVLVQRDNDYHLVSRQRGSPNKLTCETNKGQAVNCDQKQIDELVGLPYELFRCSIMLPQFGTMFLDLTPEEQASLLSDALDLDLWLRAADLSGKLSTDARGDAEGLKAKIARDDGRLAEMIEQIGIATAAAQRFDEETAESLAQTAKELKSCVEEAAGLGKKPKPAEDKETPKLAAEAEALLIEDANTTQDKAKIELDVALLERERGELTVRLNTYKIGSKCPECGQTVPASHISAKRKPLFDRLGEINTVVDKKKSDLAAVGRKMIAQRSQRSALLAAMEASIERYMLANQAALQTQSRLEVLAVEIDNLNRTKKRLHETVNPHEARLKDLETRKRDAEAGQQADKDGLASLEWSMAAYDYWQGSFRQIRLDLIDGCLGEIEAIANQEAKALNLNGWEMKLATERETVEGKIARKMSVLLYPPGAPKAVRLESYCGGEDQRWQLAIRFALSDVLLAAAGIEPSIEILDEPSIHLSPKGVEDLMVLLRERAQRLGREIWIVEQHLLDESLFDDVLDVWKDAEGCHAHWADRTYYGNIKDDPIFAKEVRL